MFRSYRYAVGATIECDKWVREPSWFLSRVLPLMLALSWS